MPKYGEAEYAKAAKLHIYADKSFNELTEIDGLPNSKSTYSDWSQSGKGTEGTPWPEIKTLVKQEQQVMRKNQDIEKRINTMDDVADNMGSLLTEAARELRQQLMEEGDSNPTFTKYADIIGKIGEVAQQKHVSDIHDRLEELASELGSIVGREVQNDTVARRLQTEMQEAFNKAYDDIDELLGIE